MMKGVSPKNFGDMWDGLVKDGFQKEKLFDAHIV